MVQVGLGDLVNQDLLWREKDRIKQKLSKAVLCQPWPSNDHQCRAPWAALTPQRPARGHGTGPSETPSAKGALCSQTRQGRAGRAAGKLPDS